MKPIISQECWDLLSLYIYEVHPVSAGCCHWSDCRKIGDFDGVNIILLNAEARKNLKADSRFVFLCPKHFKAAMANINLDNE